MSARLHATLVFLGATVLWMFTLQCLFSLGVYYPEFIEYFLSDPCVISCIAASQQLISTITGPVAAALMDNYGYRVTGVLGILFMSLGFCLSAIGNHIVFVFLGLGVLAGTAFTFTSQTCCVAVQTSFPEKQTAILGIIGFVGTFANMPLPLVIRWLTDEFGWQGSILFQACEFMQAIPLICMMIIFKEKENLKTKIDYNDGGRDIIRFTSILKILRATFDFSLLRDCRILLYYTSMFLMQLVNVFLLNIMIIRIISLEHGKFNGALVMTILTVANGCGRLIFGLLSYRLGGLPVLSVSMFLSGLFINITALFSDLLPNCIFAGIIGLFIGGCMVTCISAQTEIIDIENIAKANGFLMFFSGIGGTAASPLAELIASMGSGYDVAFHAIGSVGLLGGIILSVVTVSTKRRRLKRQEVHSKQINITTQEERLTSL